MVTSCYSGTNSCTSSHWGATGDKRPAVVASYLRLVQLNANGSVCTFRNSSPVTSLIIGEAHHYTISYWIPPAPIAPSCTSRRFYTQVSMSWQSGVPVKIDGTRPEGLFPTSMANAIVSGH